MADLIDTERALATNPNITEAQATWIPFLISAASVAAENYCNRHFLAADYDDEYDSNGYGTLLLRQFPVNRITRVMTDPRTVLTIQNTDQADVQIADVVITTAQSSFIAKDDILGQTGIVLQAIRSGVPDADVPLAYADYPTINALAAAVNAVGNGWSATVSDPTIYGKWPSSYLRSPQGSFSAAGGAKARLRLHTLSLSNYDYDAPTGEIRFGARDAFSTYSSFGPFGFMDRDPFALRGPRSIRVLYNAGFGVVPADVQQAVAIIVQKMLDDSITSKVYESEKLGDYEYRLNHTRFTLTALPMAATDLLGQYKDWRGE